VGVFSGYPPWRVLSIYPVTPDILTEGMLDWAVINSGDQPYQHTSVHCMIPYHTQDIAQPTLNKSFGTKYRIQKHGHDGREYMAMMVDSVQNIVAERYTPGYTTGLSGNIAHSRPTHGDMCTNNGVDI
jgi:hypothetical protein